MKRNHLLFAIILLLNITVKVLAEPLNLRFSQFTVENGLSQNTVLAIGQDKYGFMWFGTWEGLCRYDGYEFRIFRAIVDDPESITNNRINAIITDEKGDLWITTGDNRYIFKYDYNGEKFIRFIPETVDESIRMQLNSYSSGRRIASNHQYTWQATKEGLHQSEHASGQKTIYRPDIYSPFSLRDEVINALFLDKNNVLWVGTNNGGLHAASLNKHQFGYLSVENKTLSGNVIRAINQDNKGRLWVGTDSEGILVYENHHSKQNKKYFGSESLISPNIRFIYTDKKGWVWIGTKGGLDRYNPENGQFRHYYPHQAGSIPHPWVFYITEDYRGELWIGTFGGISRYDRDKDIFINYPDAEFLNSNRVRYILEDRHRNLWIATETAGISRLQRDTIGGDYYNFRPTHYRHIEGNPNSIINDLVLSLQEDELGYIWIGTNSGLCRLNPSTGIIKRFSSNTGFPDDLIMGMVTYGDGNIWISHKKGITRMDIRTFETRTYTRFDGLQGNEFSQNAWHRNPETGELFFGGVNGLNYFFPEKIEQITSTSKPVLTALKIMNQLVLPGKTIRGRVVLENSLLSTSKITLKHDDSNFSISFSALNFTNPNACKFKYRLVGADSEWIYTDATKREATYTHLSAGTYKFELYASNSDGVWSNEPAQLTIKVLPPWWLSLGAKFLYFLISALIGWLIYRYIASRIEFRNQIAYEKLKNEKNEELMNMKLQFFTEISHEFRTPLTLIVEPLKRLLEDKTNEEQRQYYYQLMNRNAGQLLELINQLLDFRKLQSGKLAMKFTSNNLIAFIRETASAFEQKATEKNIRFAVLTNKDELQADFDRDKMRKILNNLIANAFRFTPAFGEIIIRVYNSESYDEIVCIEVDDNGPGITDEQKSKIFEAFYQVDDLNKSTQGTGLGLALTKELVMMHGGEITVEDNHTGGARFIISIPIKQDFTEIEDTKPDETDNFSTREENATDHSNGDEGEQPLLLVIDDHEDIRTYISKEFRNKFRVITANDGLDGLKKANEHIPNLIISDVMMPGIDGNELCRRLKTDEHTSHIPIILLTAHQSEQSKIEGFETGADDYITKPFNKKMLETRINNLLEQRNKLRQLFTDGTNNNFKKIAINVTDEAFLMKVTLVIDENIENPEFEASKLATLMKMSRTQLYRKIKAMTNRSVHEFITTFRMNKAREMLLSGEFSISETAYKVGFSLPTNFTRTFTKYFGMTPSKYIDKYKK